LAKPALRVEPIRGLRWTLSPPYGGCQRTHLRRASISHPRTSCTPPRNEHRYGHKFVVGVASVEWILFRRPGLSSPGAVLDIGERAFPCGECRRVRAVGVIWDGAVVRGDAGDDPFSEPPRHLVSRAARARSGCGATGVGFVLEPM